VLRVPGDAEEQGQVTARGVAGDADTLWIDVVLSSIRPHPAHRCLAVVDGRRELVLRGEAVGDGDGDVALLGQFDATAVPALAVAGAEAAAVDADHSREQDSNPDMLGLSGSES
jgi:hypothetical protein